MEVEELDIAINELEVRLERLRALYEQYFLGFEKIEPQVARKDVERRIYVLRREKIRNTARRFRLQNIIQRYNTFQQYWQRICREIENGTYKRHLLRAERTVGPTTLLTSASRRRFGKERERAERATSIPPPNPEALAAAAIEAAPPLRRGRSSAPPRSSPHNEVGPRLPHSRTPLPGTRPPGMPPPPPRRPPPPSEARAVPGSSGSSPLAGSASAARVPPPPPGRGATGPRSSTGGGAAPPRPAAPKPPPARAPATPGTAPGSVEPRVRELHERLVAASRSAQRTPVSLEALERTVRSTEAALRAKHPNRRIEFDVVVKDGKPALKPIVR